MKGSYVKVTEAGSTIYVVGSKRVFSKYYREVLSELSDVKIIHLTKGTQLRGRTPANKKHFLVLETDQPMASVIAKQKKFIDPNKLQTAVEEYKERFKFRDNTFAWFRNTSMGEFKTPNDEGVIDVV